MIAVILIPLKISPLLSVIYIGVFLFPLFWIQRTYDSVHVAIPYGFLKASLEVYKTANTFSALKASLEVYKIANTFGISKASFEVYNILIVFGIVKAVHGMPLVVYNIANSIHILKASLEAPPMPLHGTFGVPYCSCLNVLTGILLIIQWCLDHNCYS